MVGKYLRTNCNEFILSKDNIEKHYERFGGIIRHVLFSLGGNYDAIILNQQCETQCADLLTLFSFTRSIEF